MPGLIPQSFIDDLLARTDIVDVIDRYVPLRKAGKNYMARCPFHDEKSPSFSVSQDKQFYHCFGCGASGTAVGFLMEYNRMDFVEAIEELAGKAGLEVPREGGTAAGPRENHAELHEMLELIVRFYRNQLREHPDAARAIDYLKQRGLTGELAARFELGFAPAGWDTLIRAMGQSEDGLKRLDRAGMIIRRDNGGYHDRFRDRIMFPIRDHRGRVVGFGGRTLGDDKAKYLNSPETPIFHKGRELYGLHQARQQTADHGSYFVVEGYMDVLALAQFGVGNVVATLGVAATADHLNRLYRYTDQVIFCFDGDNAGRQAAWRAMEICLPLLRDGRQAFFMFMPDGMDPDDYVRAHGPDAYHDPARRVPLSDYLLDTLRSRNDLGTREGRSRLVDQALPYIKQLPQGGLRQILTEELAAMAGTGTGSIDALIPPTEAAIRRENRPQQKRNRSERTPVSMIIELILHRPDLANQIPDPAEFDEIPVQGMDFLKELVTLAQTRRGISCAGILEHWRGTKHEKWLTRLASERDELLQELEAPEQEFANALKLLRTKRRTKFVEKLQGIRRLSDLSEEEREQWRQATAARGRKSAE